MCVATGLHPARSVRAWPCACTRPVVKARFASAWPRPAPSLHGLRVHGRMACTKPARECVKAPREVCECVAERLHPARGKEGLRVHGSSLHPACGQMCAWPRACTIARRFMILGLFLFWCLVPSGPGRAYGLHFVLGLKTGACDPRGCQITGTTPSACFDKREDAHRGAWLWSKWHVLAAPS